LDLVVRAAAAVGVLALLAAMAAMIAVLVGAALPALQVYGAGHLFSMSGPLLLPLAGTVASALIGLALAVPLALFAALFSTEYASDPVARRAALGLDIMSAVPTLVFGLWAVSVLSPWLGKCSVDPHGIGVLISEGGGVTLGGMVLAIMLLPSVACLTRKMVAAVPTARREAAFALGATRWEVVRFVVLPDVRRGVAGASLLSLGRAMGEAMALVLIVGNRPVLAGQAPSATLATTLVAELRPGIPELHASSLALLALCLVLLTLLVRSIGQRLVERTTPSEGSP